MRPLGSVMRSAKNLSDPDAALIDFDAVEAKTVTQLAAIPRPAMSAQFLRGKSASSAV